MGWRRGVNAACCVVDGERPEVQGGLSVAGGDWRILVGSRVAAKPFVSGALRMLTLDSESWRGVNRVGASAGVAVALANGFGAGVFFARGSGFRRGRADGAENDDGPCRDGNAE